MIDLEELVPIMAGLEARDDRDPTRLADVRRGLVSALGEEIAAELCDDAPSTSEIASRFFRMRARSALVNAMKMHRR